MSQESVSEQALLKEIEDSNVSFTNLLDFSKQTTSLILPTMDTSPPVHQTANITVSQFWSDSEKTVLEEHFRYHNQMVSTINTALIKGPQKLPKKPKRKLEALFKEKMGERKRRKEFVTAEDLHNYLIENIADVNTAITRDFFSGGILNPENADEVIERLIRGIRNIRRQDAQTLMIFIQFGRFLILCKAWLEIERKEGRISQTWAVWLKEKTGYSDDHGRKLRALASVLYGFPQFFRVGLPLNFILGKLNNIKEMLQIAEYQKFWSMPYPLLTTSELQHSQVECSLPMSQE